MPPKAKRPRTDLTRQILTGTVPDSDRIESLSPPPTSPQTIQPLTENGVDETEVEDDFTIVTHDKGKRPRVPTPDSPIRKPPADAAQTSSLKLPAMLDLSHTTVTPKPNDTTSSPTREPPKKINKTTTISRSVPPSKNDFHLLLTAVPPPWDPEPADFSPHTDGIMYTSPPKDGWPTPYFATTLGPFEGQAPTQIAAWIDLPGAKCLLHVHGRNTVDNTEHTLGLIRSFLTRHRSPDARIAAANPSVPDLTQYDRPNAFLVFDLPDHLHLALLSGRVFSHIDATFFVYPVEPLLPSFLGQLIGFTASVTAWHTIQRLTEDIRATLSKTKFNDLLQDMSSKRRPDLSPADRAAYFISTIRIDHIAMGGGGGRSFPTWRIYIECPASDPHDWSALVSFIATDPLATSFHGVGKAIRALRCAGCHGSDHPRGLCPFLLIPGWNAPVVESTVTQQSSMNTMSPGNNYHAPNAPNPNARNRGSQQHKRGGGGHPGSQRNNAVRDFPPQERFY